MNILVTGGAGYVGSVVAEALVEKGHGVVVLDNLQQGHRDAVPTGAELIVADISESAALDEALGSTTIDAVMHMAGETVVALSMSDPATFFRCNVAGGMNLLGAMLRNKVRKLVFSSSAAVYGEPQSVPIKENHPKAPTNAYGASKLMFENILEWYGRAYGLKHISLRYFNAAGASELLGEDHNPETHLIPNVLSAALHKDMPVNVFGTDYPTRDGSCIRDYVHVVDIAQAHILALEKVEKLSSRAYNLGSGTGHSVLDVVATASKVAGTEIPTRTYPRRPGDPAVLTASADLAETELDWKPRFPQMETILESAWQWRRRHPNGYRQ